MPELPDVDVYVEHVARRTVGHALEKVRLASPFVLRTAAPPLSAVYGSSVVRVLRVGKRIVLSLRNEANGTNSSAAGGPSARRAGTKTTPAFHLVIHLMV